MSKIVHRAATAVAVGAAALAVRQAKKVSASPQRSRSSAIDRQPAAPPVAPAAAPVVVDVPGVGALFWAVCLVTTVLVGAVLAAGAVLFCRHLEANTPPTPDPLSYTVTQVTPFLGSGKGRPEMLRIQVAGPTTVPAAQRTHEYFDRGAYERWEVGQPVPMWQGKDHLQPTPPRRPADAEPLAFALALVLGGAATLGGFALVAYRRGQRAVGVRR